ncbi:MAG: FkbM family methyltransferase [Selenomonadaceae bacterium]|nr:FkbM family methyltransferase [Selenomonadaceae bacterium]
MNVGFIQPTNIPKPLGDVVIETSFNINIDYFRELSHALLLKKVRGFDFIRAGRDGDGGYLLLNDFKPNGIAYSFGISTDVTWDNDMANCVYQIFMYDMTIDDIPKHRPEFHFFKEGIGGKKDPIKRLDTLENFIARNGHQNQRNMILKMDVEGAEWDFLETVKSETLEQFDQIILEIHGLVLEMNVVKSGRFISRLQKLNQTHQVIHIHGHNGDAAIKLEEMIFPNCLEVTYANQKNYEFEDAEIILPHPLDKPNGSWLPEYILGNWNSRFR